jgi:hypothetical protein
MFSKAYSLSNADHHNHLVLYTPNRVLSTPPQARTVLSVVSTIYHSCSLEKASQRIIVEKIGTVVEEVTVVFTCFFPHFFGFTGTGSPHNEPFKIASNFFCLSP